MKVKKNVILLALVIQSSIAGQSLLNGQQNYFSTAEKTISGVDLIKGSDKENAQVCKHLKSKRDFRIVKYKPKDIKEYGFNDGRKYYSREIEIDGKKTLVFLLKIYDGDSDLYYYAGKNSKMYFLERGDSILIPINYIDDNKQYFKKQLAMLTGDCPAIKGSLPVVHYNKRSMTNYFENYDNCFNSYIPHARIGVFYGYEKTSLINRSSNNDYLGVVNSMLERAESMVNNSKAIGITGDIPVFGNSLSLHTLLSFSRHAFEYEEQFYTETLYLDISYSSIKLPVLLRYNYQFAKFACFVDAGVSLQRNSFVINTLSQSNVRDISSTVLPENLAGVSTGIGIEYHFYQSFSVFMDMRYEINMNPGDAYYLNVANLNFSLGIMF